MYYVGVDYHKEVAVVCVLDGKGRETDQFEVPATPAGMDELMGRMGKKPYCVLGEAFTYSIDLHNYLIGRGVRSDLVRPTDLKLITRSKKKTDRNDSATIAWYLRMKCRGEIKLNFSFILRDGELHFRCLCRLREEFSREKGQTSQRIKSHMRCCSEYLPVEQFGTAPKISRIKVQEYIIVNFSDDFTLQELLRHYVYLSGRTDEIDKQMLDYVYDKEAVRLLETIPGIGTVSALELMSMIVDIGRFPGPDQMRSYFGMAPKVRDSGESVHHGHITRMGDDMMRMVTDRIVRTHMMHCDDSVIKRKYESVRTRA